MGVFVFGRPPVKDQESTAGTSGSSQSNPFAAGGCASTSTTDKSQRERSHPSATNVGSECVRNRNGGSPVPPDSNDEGGSAKLATCLSRLADFSSGLADIGEDPPSSTTPPTSPASLPPTSPAPPPLTSSSATTQSPCKESSQKLDFIDETPTTDIPESDQV